MNCLLMALAIIPMGEELLWPDFRGPAFQGHSSATNLPVTWSDESNITWRCAVPGRGWSTPVIAGDLAWMTTALEEGTSLRAVSIDWRSGRIVHDIEVFQPKDPAPVNAKNSHASPSPVTDGDLIFVHFGTMGTACLDPLKGEVVWRNTELHCDHKEGPGSSPVLWKDLVILTVDGMDVQFLAALDKKTGKLVWKSPRPQPIHENPDFCKAYSTPLIATVDGRDELVCAGAMQALCYDPATGKERWRVRYDGFSTVPRPLFGHGMFFICTGFMKPQLWAIRPGGEGDVTKTHVAWRQTRQVPANPSPLLVGPSIYMTNNTGILSCVRAADGEVAWSHRIGGNFSASPLFADGRIYFCSEEGVTTVIEPGDAYKELARNRIAGSHMASPVAIHQLLFLRTDQALYRIEKLNGARRE